MMMSMLICVCLQTLLYGSLGKNRMIGSFSTHKFHLSTQPIMESNVNVDIYIMFLSSGRVQKKKKNILSSFIF